MDCNGFQWRLPCAGTVLFQYSLVLLSASRLRQRGPRAQLVTKASFRTGRIGRTARHLATACNDVSARSCSTALKEARPFSWSASGGVRALVSSCLERSESV